MGEGKAVLMACIGTLHKTALPVKYYLAQNMSIVPKLRNPAADNTINDLVLVDIKKNTTNKRKKKDQPGLVAHAYNLSTLGGQGG